jgi:tetratricopeptide (TPR) repeat protein
VHHELGGEDTLAGRWYRRAGEEQETRSALTEQGRIALLIRGELDATWEEERLALLPQVDDPLTRVRFLRQLGTVGIVSGDHGLASARLEEALAVGRPAGLAFEVATLANNLAHVRTEQGRFDEAIELAEECRSVAEQVGSARLQMGAVAHLGFAELRRGNPAAALAYFEAAQEHNHRGGDREKLATVDVYLGLCHLELGAYDRAHTERRTALRLSLDHEVVSETVRAVAGLALLAERTGDPDRGRRLAGLAAGHPACSWEARHSLAELLDLDAEPSAHDPEVFRRVVGELLSEITTDGGAA